MSRVLQAAVLIVLLQGYKLQAFEAEPTTITTADIVGVLCVDTTA